VRQLIGALGHERCILVAHDWGGAIAWNIANQRPELTKRLMIVNSPHPVLYARELTHNPEQQAASAYMNFLIRPDAEELLRANGYERLFKFLALRDAEQGWLTEDMKRKYREVWRAGLTGGLNYYRANSLHDGLEVPPIEVPTMHVCEMLTIDVPTLVLWGMQDTALLPELVEGLDEYVPQLDLQRVPDASHWIIHEQPLLVADRLAAFLHS